MKVKLKKFTEFSKGVLPNEARYLASKVKFVDLEKLQIIEKTLHNALPENTVLPFDALIDKRKFSYIKSWIESKLNLIDVDKKLMWLMNLKEKILLDAISGSEEKEMLNYIANYKDVDYNFQIFYNIVKDYKPYLLIRMRYKDHDIVSNFLEAFKEHYKKAKEIHQTLYRATVEITNQYTLKNNETKYWERWLRKVFETSSIDGKNRYQAFVLLAFVYTNYNDYNKLRVIFDEIDVCFSEGRFYSRRILSNYYASRLLLHSKQNELNKAEHYGYLSIRQKNDDSLMYFNNLMAVLLRNGKAKQAHLLLKNYASLYKETQNHHQRIGFSSYEIRVLIELDNLELAESKAKLFLKKYKNEILKHRWHHFFTSYFNVLVEQEKYDELLKIAKKFDIESREFERQKKLNYVPNIIWSIALSKYMEGIIDDDKFLDEIKAPIKDKKLTENERQLIKKVISKLSKSFPEAFYELKSYL